jgi:hypothetical protein
MSNNNFWQLVFNQSKVNGAEYFGDRLPSNSWEWPKDTFLQRRLSELKRRRPEMVAIFSESSRAAVSAQGRKRRQARHEDPVWLRRAETLSCEHEH